MRKTKEKQEVSHRTPVVVGTLLAVAVLAMFSAEKAHATAVHWPDNGHYYEVIDSPLTWTDAFSAAQIHAAPEPGYAGYLATLTSAAENSFVNGLLNPAGYSIGGIRAPGSADPNVGWGWITAEAWSYTNWSPSSPDNATGNDNIIQIDGGAGWWEDANDSLSAKSYIIEYGQVVPLPSSVLIGLVLFAGLVIVLRSQRQRVRP